MKILTVAIPSYNSEAYMKKAIDHALVGGEDVEVLVGSAIGRGGTVIDQAVGLLDGFAVGFGVGLLV